MINKAKHNLRYFIAVNVSLGLVGIIFVLFGILLRAALLSPLLDALGIGILAAGAVNILDRVVDFDPPPQRIEVVAEKRNRPPSEIHELKYQAAKVDLIGVSLTHVLKEFTGNPGQGRIIERLLNHNLQLRLFMVHPHSRFLAQRAIEDGIETAELVRRQKDAVQLCVDFYRRLCEAYDRASDANQLDKHMTGRLQIKLLDFCPYLTIYRLNEDIIYWGLYTTDKSGVNLPLFKTSTSHDPVLYRHLYQHIHGLMERDKKYPDLVGMPDLGRPGLNEKVLADALD